MNALLDWLSLSPAQATLVGAVVLVTIHLLDIMASTDDVPGNTPREWIVRLTQWRSLWFWHADNRRRSREAGTYKRWLVPFQYLPMTGAAVPFLLGALLGHFFHPGVEPPAWLHGKGLIVTLVAAAVASTATFVLCRGGRRLGARSVAPLAIAGVLTGVFVWPVT